jgi:hypothetical protein
MRDMIITVKDKTEVWPRRRYSVRRAHLRRSRIGSSEHADEFGTVQSLRADVSAILVKEGTTEHIANVDYIHTNFTRFAENMNTAITDIEAIRPPASVPADRVRVGGRGRQAASSSSCGRSGQAEAALQLPEERNRRNRRRHAPERRKNSSENSRYHNDLQACNFE